MKYDTNITFNDGSEKIHAILTMEQYVSLNTSIKMEDTFITVTDTDGYTQTFQTNTIKNITVKEVK